MWPTDGMVLVHSVQVHAVEVLLGARVILLNPRVGVRAVLLAQFLAAIVHYNKHCNIASITTNSVTQLVLQQTV